VLGGAGGAGREEVLCGGAAGPGGRGCGTAARARAVAHLLALTAGPWCYLGVWEGPDLQRGGEGESRAVPRALQRARALPRAAQRPMTHHRVMEGWLGAWAECWSGHRNAARGRQKAPAFSSVWLPLLYRYRALRRHRVIALRTQPPSLQAASPARRPQLQRATASSVHREGPAAKQEHRRAARPPGRRRRGG
jgi:hypothetical protein